MALKKTERDGVVRRYTFKLYPNKTQAQRLDEIRRLHCTLWNAALQQRIDAYRLKGVTLTAFTQALDIKTIRADDPAYEALSADSLSGTLRRLDDAFKAFFRRAKAGAGIESGFPKYHRSDDHSGFWHRTGQGWKMSLPAGGNHGTMAIKGVSGSIKFRGRFPLPPLNILTCDISMHAGIWWASVAVELPARMRQEAAAKGEVVFDLIDSFARVRCANGEYVAGLDDADFSVAERRITSVSEGVSCDQAESPSETGVTVGYRGGFARACSAESPSETGVTVGFDHGEHRGLRAESPSETGVTVGAAHDFRRVTQAESPSETGVTVGKRRCCVAAPAAESPSETGVTVGVALRNRGGCRETGVTVGEIQRGASRRKRGSYRYRQAKLQRARLEARRARQRREALHLWSTLIARQFSDLTILKPPIKEATKSGKGNERVHGAAVSLKAEVNKHVLNQAPALAVQMLQYKIAERGGATNIIEVKDSSVMEGNDIVVATKQNRKARRMSRAS